MKKLNFFLFIFIIFMTPKVFAQEVNVTNNCYGSTGYSGMYNGQEVQYQTYNPYNFGTTYQYQLSSFETELRYNLSANTDYTLTINTNNTNDFRNNFRTYNVYDLDNNDNNLVKSFTYVSMKKVQITFKTTSATSRVQIQMGGSNVYDNITGETNWNIKSVILTVPDSSPSGSTNQDIIDNQTNNTNNIINNNNQNTSDIINNNNENTNKVVDSIDKSFNNCRESRNLLNEELFLNGSGIQKSITTSYYGSARDWRTYLTSNSSSLVNFESNTQYLFNFKGAFNGTNGRFIIHYTDDTTSQTTPYISSLEPVHITYVSLPNKTISYFTFDYSNSGTFYLTDFLISKYSGEIIPYEKFGQICTNRLDDTTSAINDVNNSINNDNVDNGVGTGFFDDFEDNDYGLSDIITIPLNTIQSLTTKTCVPLQVPIPFTNSNLTLPCMTEIYNSKFPTIYNLWKIVSFGIISYFIAIDIFHIVKGFKDPESDKVEVLDL